MKTLLTIVILFGLTGSVAAQKMDTLFGDFVIGEVTAADEATREITIKYPGKAGPEVFTGFLTDGYKLKLKDGSQRELMMNEITPGIRVRAFYKNDKQYVGGQKKKIYRIVRFEFLGADEWVRLRNQLNIRPATAVALAENDTLPSTAPLKVYVSSAYKGGLIYLAEWMDEWNAKHPDSPDKLEVVLDLNQADVLLVIAQGSDTEVVVLPMIGYVGDEEVKGQWSQATSYLVLKDGEKLKVLWTGIARVFSTKHGDSISRSRGSVTSEFEKRLTARARPAKK
ncbi:MAG TPA: hypothetical protein VJP89_13300 [Pyrinomonadaceae bacterium]|nr:hypothetical protein [Pyrinomonadaceae bacterium]